MSSFSALDSKYERGRCLNHIGTEGLLQEDKQLRMFCLIVKGDIDTEINTGAMRKDWEEILKLARDLGDAKWQYRALAQLGIAAFFDSDLETARKNVGAALSAAVQAEDAGAQIRFLTILARGLLQAKMYEQALPYVENALKLASDAPDAGYQFAAQEIRIGALIGLGQLDAAQRVVEEAVARSRQARRTSHEASTLLFAASIAHARGDGAAALAALDEAIELAQSVGLTRILAGAHARVAEIHRARGELEKAALSAELAAAATQASGDAWAVPQHLQAVAELQVARGQYVEAARTYERAGAFIDSMIGSASTVLEKTALIRASSDIYSQYFALVAEHFDDPEKACAIVEQVRGRVASDLLRAGSVTLPDAERAERTISQLRLKLMAARSTDEVRALRNQIFMVEQARWVAPGVSILKAKSHETVRIATVRNVLPPSSVLLEYVIANPNSYCLAISRGRARIVRLAGKTHIEALIAAYLRAVKAKQPAHAEARKLYDVILGPIAEAASHEMLVVVRDGQLHLVPFDGLREVSGRYVAEERTVVYSPSATSFYFLAQQSRASEKTQNRLLAVGGIPYSRSQMNRSGLTRGFDRTGFADLQSSMDEVRAASAALRRGRDAFLSGSRATEAALKTSPLTEYDIVHLAVHGFADPAYPDRAALVLLSEPSRSEDGFLQSSEIVQLRFDADLIVLSACDTAVGPLQGQEGIANLSRAFLLAGARNVVSTLWPVEDDSTLFLMRRFYAHLAANRSAPRALTAAKRDMLQRFGSGAVPYHWAGFISEGTVGPAPPVRSGR